MTISQLPPCPLPDCEGGEHHYHDVEAYAAEKDKEHDCAMAARIGYRCYGPHRPQQWQPIERDQIRAGMRIRATSTHPDRVTTYMGVAHHTDEDGDWRTECDWRLAGWEDSTTYEVDPSTIPADPDAEPIEALREASWRIEHMGARPDPLPGLPEARDLLTELQELGWTVIRESEATA